MFDNLTLHIDEGCSTAILGLNVVLSGFYSSVDTWQHQVFGEAEHRKAERIIEMLGVGTLKTLPFGSMSTGKRRRFLLGRALVNEPRALLFDEPTSGLDLRSSLLYSLAADCRHSCSTRSITKCT
ncbi:MAG: ATP-binding cassette domain-containing protein [Thermoleophilia bacterium]|nr:ATP-binding cassette domain-containing protein [Thermoleophilia bacterium]